jgi:CheY-like chemotaxis protein
MKIPIEQMAVLLVEDNRDDEELALWSLRKTGITAVTVARDGSAALTVLADPDLSLPDLALLDLRLPKVDGVEVLRQWREATRSKDLKVIVLTSSEDPRDKKACEAMGITAFLTKPLSEKNLLPYL